MQCLLCVDALLSLRAKGKELPLLSPAIFMIHWPYNGGQSDITKTSDSSPPTPNKVELWAKWVEMSAFFGHNITGGVGEGDDRMIPKAI